MRAFTTYILNAFDFESKAFKTILVHHYTVCPLSIVIYSKRHGDKHDLSVKIDDV